jgi:hypothetical protein
MLTLGPLVLGAPWGLLALLGVPAVLFIHWFRRRSPPRPVTGLFLYPPPSATAMSGRRRERLRRSASLAAELLAVLLLAWWLSDIFLARDQRGRHLSVVLDDRLRLHVRLPDGSTPAAAIRAQVGARLARLQAVDRVTVIASGVVPKILAGPATTPAQAAAALAAWEPHAAWHQLEPATILAQQISAQAAADGGEVLVASDRIPVDAAPGLGWLATGQPVAASGIADVRWFRDAEGERLLVRIVSSGAAPARDLDVHQGEHVLMRRSAVGAGTVLIPLSGDVEHLTVSLRGADPLADDDAVEVVRPAVRTVRVAVALPATAQALVERVLRGLPEVVLGPAGSGVEVLISTPEQVCPVGAWWLRLAPTAGADAALGPFLMRRGHPLARDLDGTGVLWVGGAQHAALPADAESLISAGPMVLLSEQRHGRERWLTLHADPLAGTMATHPLWPSLLANLIAARRAAVPGVVDRNRRADQSTTVVLPTGHDELVVSGPGPGNGNGNGNGNEKSSSDVTRFFADADGVVLLPALATPGTWQLRLAAETGVWQTLNVLAIDERMGDFATATTRTSEPASSALVAVERQRSVAEKLLPLLLAAVAATLACWLWLRGR